MFGQLGVNCFMLISGYFLLESKFKWIKIIKISLEASFYILFGVFILKISGNTIGIDWWLPRAFVPILREVYWFLTVYVLVYLFSPILKKLILVLSKKQLMLVLFLSTFVWSFWPTILGFTTNETESYIFFSRFIWGVMMFIFGAYIRMFSPKIFDKFLNSMLFFLISTIFIILPILIIEIFKIPGIGANYFWRPNSFLMLIWSVSLFLMFKNLVIKENRLINILASTTLGIYLFHDGPIWSLLWNKVFNIKHYINFDYFGFYLILVTIIIFLVGFVIDMGRKFLEKIFLDKFFDKIKLQKLLKKVEFYEEE
jgi:surface polysaccharide O-acyltransferase-like enzyme